MAPPRFGLALPATTEAMTTEYVRQVLDPQIVELHQQLQLLQGVRRAIAGTFGIDRRDDAGTFGQMADSAARAEFEGDETVGANGKMVPVGPLRGTAPGTPTLVTKQSGLPS